MASRKMLVAVLLITCPLLCLGQKYSFVSSEYEMEEATSTVTHTEIRITRGDPLDQAATVTIDNKCPEDCHFPAGSTKATLDSDYMIGQLTISFPAFSSSQEVPISILSDTIEEHKEYFCLRIVNEADRGFTYFTRVVIPWNDQCVYQFSIFDEGNDANALGYYIKHDIASVVSHVGPWDIAEAPTITLKASPQKTTDNIHNQLGDGNNLNIFVANRADIFAFKDKALSPAGEFKWYGLHLDDAYAAAHTAGDPNVATDGESWVDSGTLVREPFAAGTILGTVQSTEMVVSDVPNDYTLTVASSGSTITLTKTVGDVKLEGTGGTTTGLNNLFVTAANNKYAAWDICGLEPRRLPTVGIKASGHYQNFEPDLAIDNLIWYTSCFRSQPDSNNKNWLQIDMGAEFVVKKVVIYPVHYGEDLPKDIMDPEWLDNMKIYVGSCREDELITENTECVDIGDVTAESGTGPLGAFEVEDQEIIIERDCVANAIGRYVYIAPRDAAPYFGFCEVRLYGTDVPLADETKVFITKDNVEPAAVTEGTPAVVKVTQSGTNPTCTYVQYHTDRDTGNDFTEVFPSADLVIKGNSNGQPGEHDITIPTTADTVCEGDETFNVYLTGIDGGVLGFDSNVGSQCQAKVTIKDDDELVFTLQASPGITVAESSGTLTFQVSHNRDATHVASASVIFTSVTAMLPHDFTTAVAQDVTFPTTPQTVSVQIQNDNCYESSETFQVSLDHLKPTCSVGPSGPMTITITDDDSKFEFSSAGLTGNVLEIIEGQTKTIAVTRTGTVLTKTVKFVETLGSATTSDVTITPSSKELSFSVGSANPLTPITIVATDDSVAEAIEVIQLTLEDPNGSGCPNNIGSMSNVIVKILDNDFKYQFEHPTSTSVAEGTQVEICLNRICPDPSNLPASTIAISGQAVTASADDYSVPSAINIPQGQNRGCVNILIRSDVQQEPSETFNVIINSGQSGVDGSDSITFTIFDDDGTVGFNPATYTVTEGTDGEVVLTIFHTSSQPVEIRVTTQDGTAVAGSDYTALDQTYQLSAGTPSLSIPITILNDNNQESTEQFTVTLTSSNAQLASDTTATITIEDNDDGSGGGGGGGGGTTLSGGAIAGIVSAAVIGVIAVGVVLAVFGFLTGIGPFAALGATTAVASAAVPFAATGAIGATAAAPAVFAAPAAFGAAPTAFGAAPTAFAGPTTFGAPSAFGGVGPQQLVPLDGGNAFGVGSQFGGNQVVPSNNRPFF